MKFLHTADWHVGRTIRGQSRASEHEAVLAELASIAREHEVDAVLVCGDVFDMAAPTPESERIVYRALLDLAASDTRVVVIAGNHDSDRRWQAVQPLLELGAVITRPVFADPDTSVVEVPSRDGSEVMLVAALPFLSQRWVVRAEQLMSGEASESVQLYEERYRKLCNWLCARFRPDAVNVIAAHAFVHGSDPSGSERAAHLSAAYGVPATVFPAAAHYVALGHLHRPQQIPGPCPIRYCGSPLQLDFGEAGQGKVALVVEASAGSPARVTEVPLTAGRPLSIVEGSLAELRGRAVDPDAYVRVHVKEKVRLGLADEVRELFPNAVDVVLDGSSDVRSSADIETRAGRSPRELFGAYLESAGVEDDALTALFDEVYEEISA
ncbi:MAG TPA: exonuclease SbcCD subunit D [Acidimicrobiales bacterium]|jgi:exonuclease SbcD|nr:exonuclease SbcCD subunit D [Acidimicrobiales bacterium]